MQSKIGSRVTLFEHLYSGHADDIEKQMAENEAAKTNRPISRMFGHHSQSLVRGDVDITESREEATLSGLAEKAAATQIGSRVVMYEHLTAGID